MIEQLFPYVEVVPEAIVRPVEVGGFTRFALLDRGSYEIAPFADDQTLRELCAIAARHLGLVELTTTSSWVLRLRAGDYLLARHDLTYSMLAFDVPRFELVFDLSPVAVDADIHYRRRGQVFSRVPCAPRSLAIVERTPAVTCNHVYLSKRAPDACVTRLIVLVR